jgi:MscS family membrane protein
MKKMKNTIFLLPMIFCIGITLPAASVAATTPTLKQVMEKDAGADNTQDSAKKPVPSGPVDELNRGTPRSSMRAYFAAANEGDYETAARFLDLRSIPRRDRGANGTDLARKLKVVLDRTLWVDLDLLSDDPRGHQEDGRPVNTDLVGQVPLGKTNIDVLLQRVPRGDGVLIWKVSSRTVREIPRLYDQHGLQPIAEFLSDNLPQFRFLGLQTWQWVALVFLFVIAYAVTIPPVWFISRLLERTGRPLALKMTEVIKGPLRWLAALLLVGAWIDFIQPTVEARAVMQAGTLRIIIITWAMMRVADLFKHYWEERLKRTGREHAVVLLRPALSTVNVFIILIALVVWLDNIGYKVSTLLAGLGIGGLAVALAAQKSLENIIGALTLYMSAPVRVGDFCRFGNDYGTVEEIGLRSTRIRTLDKTVISVPNADFAAMHLENFAGREQFPYRPKVMLRYTARPDQIQEIVKGIETLLRNHEMVAESPMRARFREFSAAALVVEVLSYVTTGDLNEYLQIAEELNLAIMKIVQDAGAEFSFPIEGLISANGG